MQPHTPSAALPGQPSYPANDNGQQEQPAPPGWQLMPTYPQQPNSNTMHSFAHTTSPMHPPHPQQQQQQPPSASTVKPAVQTTLNSFFSAGKAPAGQPVHQSQLQELAAPYNATVVYPGPAVPSNAGAASLQQPNSHAYDHGNIHCLDSNQQLVAADGTLIKEVDGRQFTIPYWLTPERRLDAQQRPPTDPDYNARTLYIPPNEYNKLTDVMRQYWDVKRRNMDMVVLFKLGKFFEIFYDDALLCHQLLSLNFMADKTQTPHVGIPEVSFDKYEKLMVANGMQVMRVEQTETMDQLKERNKSKAGKPDKVVTRKIVSATSDATLTDDIESDAKFVLAIAERPLPTHQQRIVNNIRVESEIGACFVEITTASFTLLQFHTDKYCSQLKTLLTQLQPKAVLFTHATQHGMQSVLTNGDAMHAQSAVFGLQAPTAQVLRHAVAAEALNVLHADNADLAEPGSAWSIQVALQYIHYHQLFGSSSAPAVDGANDQAPRSLLDDLPLALHRTLSGDMEGFDGILASQAFALMMSYIARMRVESILQLKQFRLMDQTHIGAARYVGAGDQRLHLDAVTLRNLEIVHNAGGNDHGTLYGYLNQCVTPFGRRRLKEWLLLPLCNAYHINRRLDAVTELMQEHELITEIRQRLQRLPDLERYMQSIHKQASATLDDAVSYETANRRHVKELVQCIRGFTEIHQLVLYCQNRLKSPLLQSLVTVEPAGRFPELQQYLDYFNTAFNAEDATRSGYITPAPGANAAYDAANQSIEECKQLLRQHLQELRTIPGLHNATYDETGVMSRYCIVVQKGIEVPRELTVVRFLKSVNKYTTTYITDVVKHLEAAEDARDLALSSSNQEMFKQFSSVFTTWKRAISAMSALDVLCSLAMVSMSQVVSCRPVFVPSTEADDKPVLELRQAVHPVLAGADGTCRDLRGAVRQFIPNDTLLGTADNPATLMLLSGPNMGGKSTLMRQAALCVIMAQTGCYVPAQVCKLTVVDSIFTRIGASDNLMSGESTFQMEMNETSRLLKQSTQQSLVIIDELGRGTSTFDGTAIADAVLHYLAYKRQCRTLFSTHYHMLMEKHANEGQHIGLHTMQYEVLPNSEDLTFTYKLIPGAANDSKALFVALMAGLPPKIMRGAAVAAKQLWRSFQQAERLVHAQQLPPDGVVGQLQSQPVLPTTANGITSAPATDNEVAGPQAIKRARLSSDESTTPATAN